MDSSGFTPFHWAAEFGHAAIVQDLLRRGFVADAATAPWAGSFTAQSIAETYGHLQVLEVLQQCR